MDENKVVIYFTNKEDTLINISLRFDIEVILYLFIIKINNLKYLNKIQYLKDYEYINIYKKFIFISINLSKRLSYLLKEYPKYFKFINYQDINYLKDYYNCNFTKFLYTIIQNEFVNNKICLFNKDLVNYQFNLYEHINLKNKIYKLINEPYPEVYIELKEICTNKFI